MNLKDSKRLMKLGMQARVPYLLVGHSGIGKSQITEQLAKEVFPNHKFVPVFASQADVGDFIGIPDILRVETSDAEGKKQVSRVTSWARPEWMPHEPCVIFLDELNNARPDVESAMLQLVLEKRIHTHLLHPDSYICAAINPANSEYTTANTMSTALVKRFMVISFEPQSKEFIDWGSDSKRVHPTILNFLKHQPNITGVEKPLETLIKMEPCPRLWTEAVSKIYSVIEKEGVQEDRELIKDMLSSCVGVNAAAAFLGWLDTQDKPVTLEEIFKDSGAAIERYTGFYNELRNDLISATSENIVNGFKELHEASIDKFDYKTSILEYDRNSDSKLVESALVDFNANVENMGTTKKKLDSLIKFLLEVPNDVMYQISHSLITAKPFLENNGLETEVYHKAQIKRFESYNTLIFYMYRNDLIKGKKVVGLNERFLDCTKEIEKHKKKEAKS